MLIFAPKTRTVYIRFVGTHKEYDEIMDIINGRSMQRCVLLLFYADFLLVSKFFMHFCFHFHLNPLRPLCTKDLVEVEAKLDKKSGGNHLMRLARNKKITL